MTDSGKQHSLVVLVLHAGAIGDTVLGTLVPAALKQANPNCRVVYWTHESLIPLLKLCGAIDAFVPWQKHKPLREQLSLIRKAAPDVIIDLTASLRSRILCLLAGRRVCTYQKQAPGSRHVIHAATNFLNTVVPITGPVEASFPTLEVSQSDLRELASGTGISSGAIALVVGVGHLRSHRSWPIERWNDLANRIVGSGRQVLLIGGEDDLPAAEQISRACPQALNLVGKLSLPQTAAALKSSALTISGDTGPSHISVAVGTPVLGLLGPTDPRRSGPYGHVDSCIYVGHQCRCHALKQCSLSGSPGPGRCMQSIAVEQVFDAMVDMLREPATARDGADKN